MTGGRPDRSGSASRAAPRRWRPAISSRTSCRCRRSCRGRRHGCPSRPAGTRRRRAALLACGRPPPASPQPRLQPANACRWRVEPSLRRAPPARPPAVTTLSHCGRRGTCIIPLGRRRACKGRAGPGCHKQFRSYEIVSYAAIADPVPMSPRRRSVSLPPAAAGAAQPSHRHSETLRPPLCKRLRGHRQQQKWN